jgi:hypothetical protein
MVDSGQTGIRYLYDRRCTCSRGVLRIRGFWTESVLALTVGVGVAPSRRSLLELSELPSDPS